MRISRNLIYNVINIQLIMDIFIKNYLKQRTQIVHLFRFPLLSILVIIFI